MRLRLHAIPFAIARSLLISRVRALARCASPNWPARCLCVAPLSGWQCSPTSPPVQPPSSRRRRRAHRAGGDCGWECTVPVLSPLEVLVRGTYCRIASVRASNSCCYLSQNQPVELKQLPASAATVFEVRLINQRCVLGLKVSGIILLKIFRMQDPSTLDHRKLKRV